MKNFKTIFIIFIIIIFILTMISCNNSQKDSNNKEASILKSINTTVINKENISKSNTQKTIKSEKTPLFSYKLKDKYNSRSDIDKEKNNLQNAFSHFNYKYNEILSKSEKDKLKNESIYHNLLEKLDRINRKLTYSNEEILSSKKHNFYSEISTIEETIELAKKEIMVCSNDKDFDPKPAQWKIQEGKKIYKIALDIKKQYENGEISLDKALKEVSKLHIPPYKP